MLWRNYVQTYLQPTDKNNEMDDDTKQTEENNKKVDILTIMYLVPGIISVLCMTPTSKTTTNSVYTHTSSERSGASGTHQDCIDPPGSFQVLDAQVAARVHVPEGHAPRVQHLLESRRHGRFEGGTFEGHIPSGGQIQRELSSASGVYEGRDEWTGDLGEREVGAEREAEARASMAGRDTLTLVDDRF